ncbi:MAG: response regulator [Acidobacteriota bacterium]|jgi:DNA-binding response OmpR family regulator
MYRIILADDSKTIQKVVMLSFAGEGFQVESFSDGHSALAHVRRWGADVVLADVTLPEKDGYELCRDIKRDLSTAAIPVVLLAGSFEPVEADRLAWAGADATLTKPFETARLVSVVEGLIRRRRTEREPVAVQPELAGSAEPLWDTSPQELSIPGQLFKLTPDECRADFRLRTRRIWKRPRLPELTDAQFQALVDAVSQRLPETLRALLPDVARDILGRSNA